MEETLWKLDEITTINNDDNPTFILKKEAKKLGELTRQIVEAQINTSMNEQSFTHCFDIVAPVLDYSSYTAFCIEQPIDKTFPITIYKGIGVFEELNKTCNTIAEFKACLSEIFSSSKMKELIQSIIKQSI